MTLGPGPRRLLVAAGVHDLGGAVGPRALLVEGERIVWVGGDPDDAPAHDEVVDLAGAWVTPAFVDAHVHATATGLLVSGVDLTSVGSTAEALDRLRRHAEATDDRVLVGGGWDDFAWPEARPPTASEIAEAAPGRTVHLVRVDAHSCVVDPATLERLPLDALEGVGRDDAGRPTGFLCEQASEAAIQVVRQLLPPAQLDAARTRACADAAARGIGSFHEMGHPGMYGIEDARAWVQGDWPVDVLVWWAELEARPPHDLRPGGDLFLDGSIGSHSAAISGVYLDEGGAGQLFHDDDAVADFFVAATELSVGAGVHAIGDRAIEQATRAVEAAADAVGVEAVAECRHRVEHLEMPTRQQIARLARLGVVASVQPAFDAAWGGPDGLYATRFGSDRSLVSNPFAWCDEDGLSLAFGSDSTVTPLDPWGGVHAAVHHRGGLGLTRAAALRAHTIGGRYVAGQDDVGPLAPGLRADLAVWDRDPLSGDDPRLARCLGTVVRGRVAHGTLW